jgi:transcription elongation GreA/GreB family factor
MSMTSEGVGSRVHVHDGELDEWWRIVPGQEADALRWWLSAETPMARALLGRRTGDEVQVDGPGQRRRPVTILAVERPAS